MHDSTNRPTGLVQLQSRLSRFEALGITRPAAASVRRFLEGLGSEELLERETARAAADWYDQCRFGRTHANGDALAPILERLDTVIAHLEALDVEQRLEWGERIRRRSAPRQTLRPQPLRSSSPTRSLEHSTTSLSPGDGGRVNAARKSGESARGSSVMTDAERRKRAAERGHSRFGTVIAFGLVAWTLVVVAASIWQNDRLEQLLVSSEWGQPLVFSLLGEDQFYAMQSRQLLRDKRRATVRDFLYSARQHEMHEEYGEAVQLYHQALARCDPRSQVQAYTLNDLAWLLLTAKDPWYRDAEQAEALAERAVAIVRKPEYLDTLAEAYFQNGDTNGAIRRASEAVELAGLSHPDWNHYHEQLLRFQAAAPRFTPTLSAALRKTPNARERRSAPRAVQWNWAEEYAGALVGR